MIAELICKMNDLEYGHGRITYRSVLLPHPATQLETINARGMLAVEEAYVSHGSTTATLLISNLLIRESQRTTLRFLCGVLPEQYGGLSQDLED
jgi:hypothetical protein